MENKKNYGWYVVGICAVIGCLLSALFPQASMTAAALAEAMGVSQEAVLTGETFKTVGIMLSMAVSGFAYKKVGLRWSVILSMASVIVTLILSPHAASLPLFYGMKFIQGFSSMVFPLFLIVIMDWMPEKNRGISTAVYTGIFYGGAGVGGTLCGFIMENIGWEATFYVVAALQTLVTALWLVTVKEKKKAPAPEPEKKGDHALFTRILRNPMVWVLVLSFVATTWSVQAISVDMPLFGTFLGYGDFENGKIMSAITVGIVGACVVSGKTSDILAARMKSRAVGRICAHAAGCVIMILGVLALILTDLTSFPTFYALVLTFSFGASWGLGSFYCILPELFDEETVSVVTGFIGGCGDAGMTLAPVSVGILCGMRGLWSLGWGLCALIAVVSLLASLTVIRMTKKSH